MLILIPFSFSQWNNKFDRNINIKLYSNTIYKLQRMFDIFVAIFDFLYYWNNSLLNSIKIDYIYGMNWYIIINLR